MNMMQMRYKNFIWQNNPVELVVSHTKNIREVFIPYGESKTNNIGTAKRRISGRGYFTGENCKNEFESLKSVFESSGGGWLCLPGQKPIFAVMQELRLIGVQGENIVEYSFLFTESLTSKEAEKSGSYKANAGESLWDYAYRFGVDIEKLRKVNPDIREINFLRNGESVVIP